MFLQDSALVCVPFKMSILSINVKDTRFDLSRDFFASPIKLRVETMEGLRFALAGACGPVTLLGTLSGWPRAI